MDDAIPLISVDIDNLRKDYGARRGGRETHDDPVGPAASGRIDCRKSEDRPGERGHRKLEPWTRLAVVPTGEAASPPDKWHPASHRFAYSGKT
ncbi:hypothetical protein PTKU46_90460 [Paraburkholderia terrae]